MSGCSPASGTLSNLKLNNLRVSDNTYGSGPSSLGALVGINSGRIANVSASGVSVVGSRLRSNALGGLVGRNINGQITNASVSGGVTAYAASTAVGGLVGRTSPPPGGRRRSSRTPTATSMWLHSPPSATAWAASAAWSD